MTSLETEEIIDRIALAFEAACKTPADRLDLARRLLARFNIEAADLASGAPVPAPASPPLPDKAPQLWRNRDRSKKENPALFIARVYGEWLGKGLALKDLRQPAFDIELYQAYAVWIRQHPEDRLDLPTRTEVTTRALQDADPETLNRYKRLSDARRMRANRAG